MKPVRPKQEKPAEMAGELLGVIRRQFYADRMEAWFKDQHFIKANVVWLFADWLDTRGVTLPPARYRAIFMEVLQGIKQHGDTAGVKYWPRYLMHCFQEHLKHHGEEIYTEAKALRTQVENVLTGLASAQQAAQGVDPVRAMAEARRDLLAAQKAKKSPRKGAVAQGEFAL